MLLTFTKPKFKQLIKDGVKIHTIRVDKNNRWNAGNSIEFWNGNPRNVNAKNKPHQFGKGVCSKIEQIAIYPNQNKIIIKGCTLSNIVELNDFARHDGFENWDEMKTFFTADFEGKTIFWSDTIFF